MRKSYSWTKGQERGSVAGAWGQPYSWPMTSCGSGSLLPIVVASVVLRLAAAFSNTSSSLTQLHWYLSGSHVGDTSFAPPLTVPRGQKTKAGGKKISTSQIQHLTSLPVTTGDKEKSLLQLVGGTNRDASRVPKSEQVSRLKQHWKCSEKLNCIWNYSLEYRPEPTYQTKTGTPSAKIKDFILNVCIKNV